MVKSHKGTLVTFVVPNVNLKNNQFPPISLKLFLFPPTSLKLHLVICYFPLITGLHVSGSSFQLMVTIGLLYAYALGAVVTSWKLLAGLCIIPPGIYFTLMFFGKESPQFLLSKGKEEQAMAALQYFRGQRTSKTHGSLYWCPRIPVPRHILEMRWI